MTKAIQIKQLFLPIGMFMLMVGIIMSRFGGDNPILAFLAGTGFGMSLVMNTASLFNQRTRR